MPTPAESKRYYERHKVDCFRRTREFDAKRFRMLSEIKLASGCTDCGYNEHPAALQFDHVRGEKVNNVSYMRRRAWELVLDEIAKCDIVCANCHAVRTAERRNLCHP